MLTAENLTISIPMLKGCSKGCPYCISKMTGFVKANHELMRRNEDKVRHYAEAAGVSSILLTGKGEPMDNWVDVHHFAMVFKEFVVELQTNGMALLDIASGEEAMDTLAEVGVNVIAVSVDNPDSYDYSSMLQKLHDRGFVTRLCINVSSLLHENWTTQRILEFCWDNHVNHLLLRNISLPLNPLNDRVANWVKENADPDRYAILDQQIMEQARDYGKLIRTTVNGSQIWDIAGISYLASDYCIEETAREKEGVRSLVFLEDGHLYTSWNSKAAILL